MHDYSLWNPDHPSGSAFYGEAIENLPMLEASVHAEYNLRNRLISLHQNTVAIPALILGGLDSVLGAILGGLVVFHLSTIISTQKVLLGACLCFVPSFIFFRRASKQIPNLHVSNVGELEQGDNYGLYLFREHRVLGLIFFIIISLSTSALGIVKIKLALGKLFKDLRSSSISEVSTCVSSVSG